MMRDGVGVEAYKPRTVGHFSVNGNTALKIFSKKKRKERTKIYKVHA